MYAVFLGIRDFSWFFTLSEDYKLFDKIVFGSEKAEALGWNAYEVI